MPATGEGLGNVGIRKSSSKSLRIPNGATDICSCGFLSLVSIRLRVSNQAAFQPSFQQRAPDPTNSVWWKKTEVKFIRRPPWLRRDRDTTGGFL